MVEVKKIILKKVYKKRKSWSSKGDFGKLLIIGGNEKYSGAPSLNALAAISALKSGTDVVEVATVKRAADIIASNSPNLITIPLKGEFITKKHLKILSKESQNKTAFVIGGGIGREKKTQKTIRKFLEKTKLKGVIDADAIHSLKKEMNLNNFVITPHEKEFFILTGRKVNKNLKERIKIVEKEAKKLNTTILLKGKVDIISNGKKTAINKTGTPYLTKGGTGDVLAGILGSLISQGNNLFDSACAAAYINGKAGEKIKKKSSLVATDLIKGIGRIVDSI